MDTLASRIRQSRGDRFKAAIARKAGVDPSAYYRWEDGTAQPSSKHIAPLADALGVDVRWLLTGETEAA